MTQFSAEEHAEEVEDYELEGIKIFGGPEDEDGEDSDAALAASDAEIVPKHALESSEEPMPVQPSRSADAEASKFMANDKAAIDKFKRQKAELSKLSSYGGGKPTRPRKDSPHPRLRFGTQPARHTKGNRTGRVFGYC